jgi:hypothetical protein
MEVDLDYTDEDMMANAELALHHLGRVLDNGLKGSSNITLGITWLAFTNIDYLL